MRIKVNYDLCDGHGQCMIAAPEVFDLADGADQVTVLREQPPEDLRDDVEQAAAMCPVLAIAVED